MHSSETAAWTTAADLTGLGTCYGRLRRIKMDSALKVPLDEPEVCSGLEVFNPKRGQLLFACSKPSNGEHPRQAVFGRLA